jgi:lysophospholipase L1-like esterase
VYLGFGDSITEGDGSSDGQGYRARLQGQLNAWFGQGAVPADAVPATKSSAGVSRIDSSLRAERPAYTLILYGTNDWNDKKECRNGSPCPTVDNLRQMVRAAKAARSLPVVATIIPVNVGYDLRVGPDRQAWVQDTDELIRVMADQEGAALADPFTAFMSASGGNLAGLFSDHIHPNDRGYDVLAQSFFDAITKPGHASTAWLPMPLLLATPR